MTPEQVLSSYGLPGLVIFVLAGVIVFLYKENMSLRKENSQAQNDRLQDAKDFGGKVMELSNQLITTTRQLNDLFTSNNDKRGV